MPRKARRDRDGVFQRRGAFWISYTDYHGRRKQKKLNVISKTEAVAIRNAELAAVQKARVLGYKPPTEDTLSDIKHRYLSHKKARLTDRAYERVRGIIELHVEPKFGGTKLATIRREDLEKYVTERAAKVSPDTVAKEFNVIKNLLKQCVEWDIIPRNVASGMGKMQLPRVSAGRVRYLQPTELHAVLAACPEWLRPIAGLLAFTGMRRSEVLGLRWVDVDRKGGRILLPQTKNGDGRVVWLNALASDVIDSLKAGFPTDKLFPDAAPENVSLAFLRACRRIGVQDFRLHDLRHTAASWLRMQGADLQDVAALLGHRDLRMTSRYAHLSPDHLAGAARLLDKAFGMKALAAGAD